MGVSVRTKKLMEGFKGGAMNPVMVTSEPFREFRVSEKTSPSELAPLYISEKSKEAALDSKAILIVMDRKREARNLLKTFSNLTCCHRFLM